MQYDFSKVKRSIDLRGQTVREAAEAIGVSYSTISRALRSGRCHQKSALKIVKALRMTMKDIVIAA